MPSESLPRIRVIATPVANVVMLHVIGRGLRSLFDDLLEAPLPPHLESLAKALP